jgi:hypothetical protein
MANDRSPAKVLRRELAASRDRGEPFELAWPKARVKVLAVNPTWSDVLTWSMPKWRSAYQRHSSRLSALADLDPAA